MTKLGKNTKPKALNVAFVFDDSIDSNAGVAQYIKTLGTWLINRGHKVTYLVGESSTKVWNTAKVLSMSKNVELSFNKNRLSIPLPVSKKTLDKKIEERKFDVLHVQVPHSPMMAQKVIDRFINNSAVVGTFHILPAGKMAQIGSRLLGITYRHRLNQFTEIVAVSKPAADFAKSVFNVDARVIPNVVDVKFYKRYISKITPGKIVFVGRLVKRKGCYELLEAFSTLAKINSSATLTIVGDGPMRPQLEKLVKKHNLGHRVNFTGTVTEEKKAQLLACAEIACFPSLEGESFGIVLLEAMAAGSGVIVAGDNPGYRSVMSNRPDLLIDPTNTIAFANKLDEILKNNNIKKEINKWQQLEVKKYDVEQVGLMIEKVYYSAIAKRRQKRDNNSSDGHNK